jgi:hypothetical protein
MIIKRNIFKNINNLNKKLKKFISRDNLHFLINFFFYIKTWFFINSIFLTKTYHNVKSKFQIKKFS